MFIVDLSLVSGDNHIHFVFVRYIASIFQVSKYNLVLSPSPPKLRSGKVVPRNTSSTLA